MLLHLNGSFSTCLQILEMLKGFSEEVEGGLGVLGRTECTDNQTIGLIELSRGCREGRIAANALNNALKYFFCLLEAAILIEAVSHAVGE